MPENRRKRQSRTLGPGREFRISGPPNGGEFRAVVNDNDITFEGLAIRYEASYSVRDMFGEFVETMKRGAAADALDGADVRFLFNHDGLPLARTTSGTLQLTDTDEGLQVRATVDRRQTLANDLAIALERGDVSQMSVGFTVGNDEWNSDFTQRSIYRIAELFDVSAVTYPASPTTSIELGLRSLMAAPVESRARLRNVYIAAREAREGKVLSAENAALLNQALEALHAADDVDIPGIVRSLQDIDSAVDVGQAGIAAVLGKSNPDGDAADLDPELGEPISVRSDEPEAETREEPIVVETPRHNTALELEQEMLALRARGRHN